MTGTLQRSVSGNTFSHVPRKFFKIVYHFIKWVSQSILRTLSSNHFWTVTWSTNRVLFKPSCIGLDLRKTLFQKQKVVKQGYIVMRQSYLAIHSCFRFHVVKIWGKWRNWNDVQTSFHKQIFGEIFDKAHSNNYLFSKYEGLIFEGITVLILRVCGCLCGCVGGSEPE